MRHYPTDNGGHWAVAPEASGLGVLVQVMESKDCNNHPLHLWPEQARELLTTEEARALAGALLDCAMSVENKGKQSAVRRIDRHEMGNQWRGWIGRDIVAWFYDDQKTGGKTAEQQAKEWMQS